LLDLIQSGDLFLQTCLLRIIARDELGEHSSGQGVEEPTDYHKDHTIGPFDSVDGTYVAVADSQDCCDSEV